MALSIGHLAVDLCTGIWPVYKTLAMLDLTKAGLVATAGSVIGNALQPIFGVLADRGWRKPLLVGGLVLAGAVIFVPYFTSFLSLFFLVLLTSVGSAAFHPAGTGASSSLSEKRTGVMVAVFLTGGYVGYALSQLAFTATYRTLRGSTGLLFIVPLITALAMARVAHSRRIRAQPPADWWKALVTKLRPLQALFLVQFLSSAANVALIFLLPDLLLARGAPNWIVHGGGHAALVLGGALSLVPAGHAADRLGAPRVLVLANVLAGVLLIGLILGPNEPWFELAMAAGYGAANGANNVVAVAEGNRVFPGQASAVSALLMGLPWCFSGLAPVVAGFLADPTRGGSPTAALGWIGLCIPCALFVSGRVPRRQPVVR
jgi:FSR family fosmidomycin resistance protein-like MFS transporter